jgi:hypothetical protein
MAAMITLQISVNSVTACRLEIRNVHYSKYEERYDRGFFGQKGLTAEQAYEWNHNQRGIREDVCGFERSPPSILSVY